MRQLGFDVTLAENLFTRHSYLSGSDSHRVAELNRFFRDPSFDAFFFSRGGYGAMRILEQVDFAALADNPRPVIGYSDVTALHQAIAIEAALTTFHGPMLNTDFYEGLSGDRLEWFFSALDGAAGLRWEFAATSVVAGGSARGLLFGGCLSLTTALHGTPYDFWIPDGVWFWEDVSEPTYRIDRMLTTLRLSGRLDRIQAVLIGQLKDCGSTNPAELDQLIEEFFAGRGIPVVRDLPFGHLGNNLLLPVGAPVEVDTESLSLRFPEPFVSSGSSE